MNIRRLIAATFLLVWIACSSVLASPLVWNIRSAPSSSQLNGVAFGNGLFVAVGSDTTILTSTSGREWTARSAGMTAPTGPTLDCAAYGTQYGVGGYAIGGGEGALIRSSTDGVHWTNGLSTIGIEHIHGIAYGYGVFVAVGGGAQPNTSYILTSSNGVDWTSQKVPTTNTLFGISPAYGNGVCWADKLFVAVGDRGTIITSVDGVNWVLRDSGTAAALRAVVFHQGIIVGGDAGTVLRSYGPSDALSFPPSALTSFNIRGLASSGSDLVAVGNYSTTGRLQVSTDGLTWPDSSSEFAQPLNAVAYGAGSFVAVGDGGLIIQSGATNEWTKPTSGYWDELDSGQVPTFWSLGSLPSITQDLVAFKNPGWKALSIGANTTANFPDSLGINNLTVDAPAGSFNQLLLNYAGLDVPLSVASDFILGSNGSLVSYYSALRGGNLYLSGPATISEGSTITFSKIELEANVAAELNLSNSVLEAELLILGPSGTVAQSGGSSQITNVQMYANSGYSLNDGTFIAGNLDLESLGGTGLAQFLMTSGQMEVQGSFRLGRQLSIADARGEFVLAAGCFQSAEMDFLNGKITQTGGTNATTKINLPSLDDAQGDYFLLDGTLISSNVLLGAVLSPSTPPGRGNFEQSGGAHTNVNLELFGEIRHQAVAHYGSYSLSGGLLVSDAVKVSGGAFSQTGGTNRTQELVLDEAGSYVLNSGDLVTSNTTVGTCCCVRSDFIQNGGNHIVQNRLLLDDFVSYQLRAGTLTAANIEIGPGAELLLQDGVVSNAGLFTIRSGAVRAGGQSQQLGQLQVLGVPVYTCIGSQANSATLDVGLVSGNGAATLHFLDSRDVPWSGSALSILNWSPSTNGFGPDLISVGTNAEGLTSSQLGQLTFINPVGWPPGNYPARMLPTGEIAPAVPPPLSFTRSSDGLVMSWGGDYELVTATNVAGPYSPATGLSSLLTNRFLDSQRFFKLRVPAP